MPLYRHTSSASVGTLVAENRSQAAARRRTSQAGPPIAEDASAVNVVRGLPLADG
jgi:hypothetical protein